MAKCKNCGKTIATIEEDSSELPFCSFFCSVECLGAFLKHELKESGKNE